MADFNALLKKLNEEQIKPVLACDGPVLVVAGAGSGKTRVLTMRIAYLVKEKGVNPSEILAITFTNKAAREMKDRIEKLVGESENMWVSTIHSLCVRILRRDIDKLGFDTNFTIYDETDKDKALKRVVDELGYDAEKLLKNAKSYISNAKNEGMTPEEFKKEFSFSHFIEEYYNIYTNYQKLLERSNALDFDDLLVKTYELFIKHPEVCEYYAQRFKYIHIDEFQDTNKVQFDIAKKLASVHRNIFVVGDDDQSIYGWRGAKIENILSFDRIYPDAKVFKLQRNYRSTKNILAFANRIIANNTERREKQLYTDNPDGAKIETFIGEDEMNEAAYVAMQIRGLMSLHPELTYKDFAVFMRLNALSRAFEQEFAKYGISYRVYGGFRFFERKEIKDILSYLKIINNPYDDESFLRSVSCPKRGIGEKSLRELKEFASMHFISLSEAVARIDETSLSAGAKARLKNFKSLIDSFRSSSLSKNASVSDLIDEIINATSFMEQFEEKNEENTSKKYNISELKNSALEYEKFNRNSSLADYLNSITLSTDVDGINEDDCVTVATIHAVKGLEYKNVFIAGLDENILPIQRNGFADEDIEEERRLMYVAVTRAKERLYLTRAVSRFMYGRRERMKESRFIKEGKGSAAGQQRFADGSAGKANEYSYARSNYGYDKGNNMIDDEPSVTSRTGYSSNYARSLIKDNKPQAKLVESYGAYKSGVKVKHVKFGTGTVIAVKGSGENTIVDVAFVGVGIKELSVKYAPMEIVK